jgi:hypothetical protein
LFSAGYEVETTGTFIGARAKLARPCQLDQMILDMKLSNGVGSDVTPLDEVEAYGDCLTHAARHCGRWEEWQALGLQRLTAADYRANTTNGHAGWGSSGIHCGGASCSTRIVASTSLL